MAIKTFEVALSVNTLEAFPQEWAMNQYNLASAYTHLYRINTEKVENLERFKYVAEGDKIGQLSSTTVNGILLKLIYAEVKITNNDT